MQKRHLDKSIYFKEQIKSTEKFLIPYIEDVKPINQSTKILEVGCGIGGLLVPFIERGCANVVGVDISIGKIKRARKFLKEYLDEGKVELILQDIYEFDPSPYGGFDVIILRDALEHIPDQGKFLGILKEYLSPSGVIFIAFPPWRMPFGGHQQNCKSKVLSHLPYFHLLPRPLYKGVLRLFGENKQKVDVLMEYRDTGISISTYNRILRENRLKVLKYDLFFINPNYEVKFGLKPRKLNEFLGKIPFFKDFFTTCVYSLVSAK